MSNPTPSDIFHGPSGVETPTTVEQWAAFINAVIDEREEEE